MEVYLRQWRDDAASRHQYDSAVFIGDKLLAFTGGKRYTFGRAPIQLNHLAGSDQDALGLARLHFLNSNYTRALNILARRGLIAKNLECQYLAAHCHVKTGRFEDALLVLGDRTPQGVLAASNHNRRKIQRTGKTNRTVTTAHKGTNASNEGPTEDEKKAEEERRSSNRLYAGMSHLRGLCFAKQNAFDRAKECYKEAVLLDVQCYEAFDQLMKNALMSPEEERSFVESLNFDSISVVDDPYTSQQAAEMTNFLYQTRCSKFFNTFGSSNDTAIETLSTHYRLASNPDLLLAKAELLFVQCRFREALAMTEAILEDDRFNFEALPVHLACLYELNEKNALFLLAHDLADHHPEEPATWLAVGIYYLTTGKIAEARRMFSKASMMDPHYGPAWIGFAHTFAAEGEHDQAIAAYTTSARLFQGTHLPQLFLGMQNLQLLNMTLAREYLNAASAICPDDPLLLNERGVVAYQDGDMAAAAEYFERSIAHATEVGAEPRSWIATRINLGHAYRRMKQLDAALEQYEEVLRQGGRDVGVFSAKAMVLMDINRPWEATIALHEALDINSQDAIANELLAKALEEQVLADPMTGASFAAEDTDLESALAERKSGAASSIMKRSRQQPSASGASQ